MKTNPDDAVFSSPGAHIDGIGITNPQPGLTKREYFAAMALQGLLSNPGGPVQQSPLCGWHYCNCEPADIAADALIEELNKKEDEKQ